MLIENLQSGRVDNVRTFVALLQHYGLYQPEELYKVVCPFHQDRNASLQINIPKAFFYCYAECGAKGSTLELYKCFWKLEHPNEPTPNDIKCWKAISYITKGNGAYNTYNNIYSNIGTVPFVENKPSYKEGLALAREYYYNLPGCNWYKPSLVPSVEEECRLCKQYMKHRGFSANLLTRCGAKPSLNKYYPIVIPLMENGKFRGYVMRTFDKEVEQQRKYMYGRGFKREQTLPGEYGIKTGSTSVILVEGYLDKLKGNQLGFKNMAALLGWKISNTQINLLKRAGVTNLLCATDNDEAGNKGYRYLKRVAKLHGFTIHRIHYPKGIKDMGDIKPGSTEHNMVKQQVKKYFI